MAGQKLQVRGFVGLELRFGHGKLDLSIPSARHYGPPRSSTACCFDRFRTHFRPCAHRTSQRSRRPQHLLSLLLEIYVLNSLPRFVLAAAAFGFLDPRSHNHRP